MFEYPSELHVRRHGPRGYRDYRSYRDCPAFGHCAIRSCVKVK